MCRNFRSSGRRGKVPKVLQLCSVAISAYECDLWYKQPSTSTVSLSCTFQDHAACIYLTACLLAGWLAGVHVAGIRRLLKAAAAIDRVLLLGRLFLERERSKGYKSKKTTLETGATALLDRTFMVCTLPAQPVSQSELNMGATRKQKQKPKLAALLYLRLWRSRGAIEIGRYGYMTS